MTSALRAQAIKVEPCPKPLLIASVFFFRLLNRVPGSDRIVVVVIATDHDHSALLQGSRKFADKLFPLLVSEIDSGRLPALLDNGAHFGAGRLMRLTGL